MIAKSPCGIVFVLLAAAAARGAPDGTTAVYRFRFDGIWSEATHPTGFPSNPHFSSLVGATHNADVRFWEVGQLASWGVERVAESGNKGPLLAEVDQAIAEGTADARISLRGLSPSPGSFTLNLSARSTYSQITLISMIAPSPDWFIGVSGLNLREGDQWREEIAVDLWAYDAGTEEGTAFSTVNPATDPPEPVFLLDTFPFEDAPPVARYTFQLVSVNPPLVGDMNDDGMIDFDDVAPFVLGLTDPAAYEAAYGLAPTVYGDTDGSGQFDFDDIEGFVAVLNTDAVATATVPEPSSAILLLTVVGLLSVYRSR